MLEPWPARFVWSFRAPPTTSSPNARLAIDLDEADRETFLAVLAQVIKCFNRLCRAYCLLGARGNRT
jgi:hypothetical protein